MHQHRFGVSVCLMSRVLGYCKLSHDSTRHLVEAPWANLHSVEKVESTSSQMEVLPVVEGSSVDAILLTMEETSSRGIIIFYGLCVDCFFKSVWVCVFPLRRFCSANVCYVTKSYLGHCSYTSSYGVFPVALVVVVLTELTTNFNPLLH